jgi:nucleoid-associated protein YgaU
LAGVRQAGRLLRELHQPQHREQLALLAPVGVLDPVAEQRHRTHRSDATVRTSTAGTGSYVVKAGDTLSKIAASHGVNGGWRAIWAGNRSTIADPDLIFVGQRISL